ncbi:MAG TPA: TetR/AcrR family transcriptional regulator [Streptosporangiaceae bacterium]|nr:TetR/AcrR family transcriptional regulator [Streptosporangiaceae bacterium]
MAERADAGQRHVRNPRGEGDRLRHELISAANRLLENGTSHESLSLRAVAREVGIAATSVYLHFPDKTALLLAVYEGHFAELAEQLNQAIAQHSDPAARLRAAAGAYCAFAASNPDVYQVLFSVPGSASPARLVPVSERPGSAVVLTVQNVITDCINAGLLPPADPYAATVCLWGTLHGLIVLRAARPNVNWPPFDALIDTLLTMWLTKAI